MTTPHSNMIHSLAATLAAGHTTNIALTETALERTELHRAAGRTVYVSIGEQAALATARAAGATHVAGNMPSLLARLPVSIRDLFDITGQVTTAGSRTLADQPHTTADAAAVVRLRATDAVLLGCTNMSKFAFSGLGLNPHCDAPHTSADGARTAGDSTSGSTVTVAGGMAVTTLGTDTDGSIRIPSAFRNLIGFKPTARHVPMTDGVLLSTSLGSGGPLANSVDCCVIVDAVLSDESDNGTFDAAAVPLAGLRFGVAQDCVGANLDNTVTIAFNHVVERPERTGAHIMRFEFPGLLQLPEINSSGGFSTVRSWAWHRSLLTRAEAQYDPRVATRIRRGDQMSAVAYIDVINACVRMIAAAHKRLGNFDAWLMPVVAIVPPRVTPFEADDATFFRVSALALRSPSVINFLDGCALTLPVHAAGEPSVGLSLCSLTNDDARILHVDRAVEAALRC